MSDVRKHLDGHVNERLDMERAQICINILELMDDPVAGQCIKLLLDSQRRQLKRMDGHSAAMGAPHPESANSL